MMSLATPVLEALSRETGESAHFSVRMGDAVVVLARTSGPGAFQMADRVGVVRPAYCTALGKIMLAALGDEQFEGYIERTELTRADAEHHYRARAPAPRDRRGAPQPASPSTTASSIRKRAAWRCRCAISPAR